MCNIRVIIKFCTANLVFHTNACNVQSMPSLFANEQINQKVKFSYRFSVTKKPFFVVAEIEIADAKRKKKKISLTPTNSNEIH